jgi:hypothetical protein
MISSRSGMRFPSRPSNSGTARPISLPMTSLTTRAHSRGKAPGHQGTLRRTPRDFYETIAESAIASH